MNLLKHLYLCEFAEGTVGVDGRDLNGSAPDFFLAVLNLHIAPLHKNLVIEDHHISGVWGYRKRR